MGVLALVGIAALSALSALGGFADVLAYLLPPLLLLLALAARRYPGERALLAIIEGRRHERRSADGAVARAARPRATVPRGGRLIASSLAVRPPPAPRAATS